MFIKGNKTEYNIEIDVSPKEIIDTLRNHFGFTNRDYTKDNKIYTWFEEGYHNTWIEHEVIDERPERVELLKAIETISKDLVKQKNGTIVWKEEY